MGQCTGFCTSSRIQIDPHHRGSLGAFLNKHSVLQVCVHSDGGDGAAAAGLSLSEHQPAGGEFPQYTEIAAGGRQTTPAHPRHKLCTKHTHKLHLKKSHSAPAQLVQFNL